MRSRPVVDGVYMEDQCPLRYKFHHSTSQAVYLFISIARSCDNILDRHTVALLLPRLSKSPYICTCSAFGNETSAVFEYLSSHLIEQYYTHITPTTIRQHGQQRD
jgi:hypothetical protein